MNTRPPSDAGTVTLLVDGVPVRATAGQSVAAALVNRAGPGAWQIRRSVGEAPRGPLCGMGICFECRAMVDGRPHERTCMVTVRDGMEVRTDG
jgi:sarcosine oxidase subunit alpha